LAKLKIGGIAMKAVLALAGALSLGLPIEEALAYGAIAIGRTANGQEAGGMSYSQPTPEVARETAVQSCRESGHSCAVVHEFSEVCIVFYRNPVSGKLFFQTYHGEMVSDAQVAAGRAAEAACSRSPPGWCQRVANHCDTRAATQQAIADIEKKKRADREAVEKEQRKAIAEKDCPREPSILGGPWFSSTYRIGALDAARNAVSADFDRVFCVKSVEYLSDAPNPFGGKAARARFIVYDRDYKLVSQTRDFPY
jgi:uncharacterized protein DUF4189